MKIQEASFWKSVVSIQDIPKAKDPHIAFVGRSNVGKSSLLNVLMSAKLAKTSSTPGKTREINFFHINRSLYFVDMPGYGYARVSRQQKKKWDKLLGDYFKTCSQLQMTIIVIDARHPTSTLDVAMTEFLTFFTRPYAVVLSKTDKLSRPQAEKTRSSTEEKFPDARFLLPFSLTTKEGRLEVLEKINAFL